MKTLSLRSLALVAGALMVLAGLALAQDASTTVNTAEHEQYGSHLTDAEGNALYLFVNENAEATEGETMTEGVRSNAAACEGGCLDNWPPLEATDVMAGESLDSELLYTADVAGTTTVVYNGWPLYHFANDAAPGDTNGQGLGGGGNTWYLVSPAGTPLEGESGGAGAMDGAADDGAMDGAGDDAGAAEDGD